MVRCNDLLAVGSGALDMLSCMPSLRRVYLNGLPTMVDVEVRTDYVRYTEQRSAVESSSRGSICGVIVCIG